MTEPGRPPATPPAGLVQDEPDDLAEIFRRATTPSAELDRIALPGVQVKVSAAMISTPLATASGPATLKLNPTRDYPRLVHNEHFFLRMAAGCGLEVPEHRLAHDRAGQAGLLVSRVDRLASADGLQRLAQEDACQLLGCTPRTSTA